MTQAVKYKRDGIHTSKNMAFSLLYVKILMAFLKYMRLGSGFNCFTVFFSTILSIIFNICGLCTVVNNIPNTNIKVKKMGSISSSLVILKLKKSVKYLAATLKWCSTFLISTLKRFPTKKTNLLPSSTTKFSWYLSWQKDELHSEPWTKIINGMKECKKNCTKIYFGIMQNLYFTCNESNSTNEIQIWSTH